ncbi:hypothetical protein L2D14_01530 [Thalassospiraceae bacterium LMO-JJ14]|nr:hypothetical protein L2D14_01530 [Thalassospiraceae bacterium LMO-JJ14]
MGNGSKPPMNTRKKLVFLAAGIAVFFVLINLLPQRWPLFPAEDSIFRADRLLRDGKCEEGYAIFEKLAAKEAAPVTYLRIGDDKYEGLCGGKDPAGAVKAYRKAALKGMCSANFYLAAVALMHPQIVGVEQAPPENNLFAATICSRGLSDEELMQQYFIDFTRHRDALGVLDNAGLRDAFRDALLKRQAYLHLPGEKRRSIAKDIRDGINYDANPNPLRWTETRKSLK